MDPGDLLGVSGPGIREDRVRTLCNCRHHIDAVARAGDDPPQLADRVEDHGRAGLQARDAARSVIGGHKSILNVDQGRKHSIDA